MTNRCTGFLVAHTLAASACMGTVIEGSGKNASESGSERETSPGSDESGSSSGTAGDGGGDASGGAATESDDSGVLTSGSDPGEGSEAGGAEETGIGETDANASGTGEAGAGETGAGETGAGETGAGETGPDDTTGKPEPCEGVDVLFALDDSSNMGAELEALTAPQVFEDMTKRLADFHLGIMNACPKRARLHDFGAGIAGLGQDCDFPEERNFLVSTAAQPLDLGRVECVTRFDPDFEGGYRGLPDQCLDSGLYADDDEQPAFTAAAALHEVDNAGFLREGAALLIVTLTDEDEKLLGLGSTEDPPVTPAQIHDKILEAKAFDPAKVVFLGIGGETHCIGDDAAYDGGALEATNLRAVTETFGERGLFWNLCKGEIEQAVQAALDRIDPTCMQ